MNVNFGLFPPLAGNRAQKKPLHVSRARAALSAWLGEPSRPAARAVP